ncbi:MAG: thiamine biosynthesis protein ThiS [Gammaproteobacteria bacterium RBG_16_51_14]|nr:MAG: thiamine biosynthesis protein ThiS [Gammaproteobacteria bacterium RBG_16_51_14]
MEIILNGKPCAIVDFCSVTHLLEGLQIGGRLAVEINEHIIPRSQFDSHIINPGDRIEIVYAIGGG